MNQIDATTSTGMIKNTVMAASSTLVVNSTTVMTTMVSPWMASCERPSWSSCWRFSMSLVIRLMITPAFSSVKKPSDSRCRWVKIVTRRSFMTQAAIRPVTRTWARWDSAVQTMNTR